jgi:hypothetical protein
MNTISLSALLEKEYGKPVTITEIRVQGTNSLSHAATTSAVVTLQLQIVPEGEAPSITWLEIKR